MGDVETTNVNEQRCEASPLTNARAENKGDTHVRHAGMWAITSASAKPRTASSALDTNTLPSAAGAPALQGVSSMFFFWSLASCASTLNSQSPAALYRAAELFGRLADVSLSTCSGRFSQPRVCMSYYLPRLDSSCGGAVNVAIFKITNANI